MKIGYLILCHTDPAHIGRLVRKITENTSHEAFIHVDAKVDIAPFRNALSGVTAAHFVENRVPIHWGGYSSVEATVRLMKEALEDTEIDRLVLLQGLEYPIKSNRDINQFFEENCNVEFIKAQDISHTDNKNEYQKYRLLWSFDRDSLAAIIYTKLSKYLVKIGCVPHFKKNYIKTGKRGEKLFIYQGCAQFGVTREAASYIVAFHDSHPKFNHYFRTVFAPDESYFHTVIYNSKFANRTVEGRAVTKPHLTQFENLTYFEYPTTITLFTSKNDWEKLRDSGFLFFRKASSQSKELLDYIDAIHKAQEE